MSKFIPPYNSENIKVELDLSNYATKKDIKDITHIAASRFALKTNLAALKTEVDKIDTDKLKTVPDNLAKLSNVVKNDVVKKTDFSADDYVKRTKFSADTNALVLMKLIKLIKKIPDVSDLIKKSALTAVENKIPDISCLATKSALAAVENKIPNVAIFVKKNNNQILILRLLK